MIHTTTLQVEDDIILFPFSVLNLIDTRCSTTDRNWRQMMGFGLSSGEFNVTNNNITISLTVGSDGKQASAIAC